MVRAILEGRKTQTRRIIKPQPIRVYDNVPYQPHFFDVEGETNIIRTDKTPDGKQVIRPIKCPFGQPGDRLWVRETVQVFGRLTKNGFTDSGKQKWEFLASPDRLVKYAGDFVQSPKNKTDRGYYTRPAIHAPRWTSRITLEITDVRVERLRDISETGAVAEGVEVVGENIHKQPVYKDYVTYGMAWSSAVRSFQSLWQKINGDGAWEQNPFVWAITFKRINP